MSIKMKSTSLDTHSGVKYHWKVWQLMGILQPKGIPRRIYKLYAIGLNILVTLIFPLSLLSELFFTHNLQTLCENLSITITDLVANLKFFNVFLVRRQLHEIKQLLQHLDKRAMSLKNADELFVLQEAVKTARKAFRIFAGIFIFGTTLSCIRVAFAKNRVLLYPAWFGVDWKDSDANYIILCMYQLFGLLVQSIQQCANDSYPPAYLCILTAHMRALELRVRRIGYERQYTRTNKLQRLYWLYSNNDELVACIKDFTCVHRLRHIIQEILSTACLVQFICSGLVQCTVAMHFLYVADSHDLSAMILSIVFFVAVTLEIFILCYFGENMSRQSDAMLDAFYSCNWPDQLPVFKKNLIITLMRAQRPSIIVAGGFISLSLETFLRVMKFAYSVFTLLLKAM